MTPFRPEIAGDQLAFLRNSLSALNTYAATQRSSPDERIRLAIIADVTDALFDLASVWDWAGYERAEPAIECLDRLSEHESGAPELIEELKTELFEVVARLQATGNDAAESTSDAYKRPE
jgi:hypothetical protein